MKSDGVILVVMLVFYVPALSLLILGRRSWVDVFTVGLTVTILAMAVNRWLPPVGAIAYAALHGFWGMKAIQGHRQQRRKAKDRQSSNKASDATSEPAPGADSSAHQG